MTGSGARPPASGEASLKDGQDRTPKQAAEYIASLLEGLRLVAHNAELPFLAYLINIAIEEAKSEKASQN